MAPNQLKVYHVASLGQALELCAKAIIEGTAIPTFTVDAEDFERFRKYMAKSYSVHWPDGSGGATIVNGILPLFQAVRPGDPRGETPA